MKLLVLYRPNSEYARAIETFVHDLQTQHNLPPNQLQVMDFDSREAVAMVSMYDVTSQPTLLVTDDNGAYIKHWEGSQLPLTSEVLGYLVANQ